MIRDLSTKAASDGMGDNEMGKFARGEKTRLSDQRKVYKERVQEIWIRQIAALSLADPGNDVSRADSEILPAMDSNEVDVGSDAGGEKGAESDDDDDDDDDFANELMMDMTSSGEANRLVAQLNENADPSMRTIGSVEGLSKDARELAAFKRQREEERALQHGFGKKGSALGLEENKRKKSKCIRRKVTKVSCASCCLSILIHHYYFFQDNNMIKTASIQFLIILNYFYYCDFTTFYWTGFQYSLSTTTSVVDAPRWNPDCHV